MGGLTRSVIFEPWAPGAYAAVEVNCSEHGNQNPGVGGSSPSPATIKSLKISILFKRMCRRGKACAPCTRIVPTPNGKRQFNP
jgi:hypothetical protein